MTWVTAYAPFTPSKSEQRLLPPYYRGCWHGVSRSLLRVPSSGEVFAHPYSSPSCEVYIPRNFILHAALLGQACAHCPKFPTAASRRSLTRIFSVSVADRPLRPATDRCLGGPLPHQLANPPRASLQARGRPKSFPRFNNCHHLVPLHDAVLIRVSPSYSPPEGKLLTCYSPVRHSTPHPKAGFAFDLHV